MTGTLSTSAGSLELTPDRLLRAYRTMRTIRVFEERVHEEFATGEIPGFVHLYAGEEASATGVCQHLDERDVIASTHRGHGHCLAKGGDPERMFAELYGHADGYCKGRAGSMHIADPGSGILGATAIVGGSFAMAVGAAFSAQVLGADRVAVAPSTGARRPGPRPQPGPGRGGRPAAATRWRQAPIRGAPEGET